MRRPSIIAHRGASGYEYENSRAAFRRAVLLDADGVELDIHATRDNAIVVYHDAELPGLGAIGQLTLAEVRGARIRNGETVPLLAEVLEILHCQDVWAEIKTLPASADAALLDVLDQGPSPARYAVHSFDHRVVQRLGKRRPALRRGLLLSCYLLDPITVLRAAGATTLWQEWRMVDQQLVNRIHEAGAAIIAWTVNETGDLERLTRLGVDGLCGNYPDRLRIAAGHRVEDVMGADA